MSNLRPGFWWQNMALSSKSHNMHTHLSQFRMILDNSCTHTEHTDSYSFPFSSIQYISCVLKPVLLSTATKHKRSYCQSFQGKVFSGKNNKCQSIPHTNLSYGLKNLEYGMTRLWCFYRYLFSSLEPFIVWKTETRTFY